jgi:hypothetical protein
MFYVHYFYASRSQVSFVHLLLWVLYTSLKQLNIKYIWFWKKYLKAV